MELEQQIDDLVESNMDQENPELVKKENKQFAADFFELGIRPYLNNPLWLFPLIHLIIPPKDQHYF